MQNLNLPWGCQTFITKFQTEVFSLRHFLCLNNSVNSKEIRKPNLPQIYDHDTEGILQVEKTKRATIIINTANDQ